jgi:hypothetical protein
LVKLGMPPYEAIRLAAEYVLARRQAAARKLLSRED